MGRHVTSICWFCPYSFTNDSNFWYFWLLTNLGSLWPGLKFMPRLSWVRTKPETRMGPVEFDLMWEERATAIFSLDNEGRDFGKRKCRGEVKKSARRRLDLIYRGTVNEVRRVFFLLILRQKESHVRARFCRWVKINITSPSESPPLYFTSLSLYLYLLSLSTNHKKAMVNHSNSISLSLTLGWAIHDQNVIYG